MRHRIANHQGIQIPIELVRSNGMANAVWSVGDDHILRIGQTLHSKDEVLRERRVVPLVRAQGVRTPELVTSDATGSVMPHPYTLYQRVKGVALGDKSCDRRSHRETFVELGRQIALIGEAPLDMETVRVLLPATLAEPWLYLVIECDGLIDSRTSDQISGWLQDIESLIRKRPPPVLVHQDIHPWNVICDARADRLTAVIDWGDAGFGDPAIDFASMPLRALPLMLEGYAERGGVVDDAFVARALCQGMALSLWEIHSQDVNRFARGWWRMPNGGWRGMKHWLNQHYPALAPKAP